MPTAVPYANFGNPQSLNLYSYVKNNPTTFGDPDGHCCFRQKLGNWFGHGLFVDNAHLDEALQEEAQKDLANLWRRRVTINGRLAVELLKGLTNQQIIDAYGQINQRLAEQQAAQQQRYDQYGAAAVAFTSIQLQAKFKHAGDFGVSGNYNPAKAAEFQQALEAHLNDPLTTKISGTYRGQPADIYYNSGTGNAVITDTSGNFISGWKLSPAQAAYVTSTGNLGGGP
jgi:hypothetical protein